MKGKSASFFLTLTEFRRRKYEVNVKLSLCLSKYYFCPFEFIVSTCNSYSKTEALGKSGLEMNVIFSMKWVSYFEQHNKYL
jgi:hypothetical protein